MHTFYCTADQEMNIYMESSSGTVHCPSKQMVINHEKTIHGAVDDRMSLTHTQQTGWATHSACQGSENPKPTFNYSMNDDKIGTQLDINAPEGSAIKPSSRGPFCCSFSFRLS